MVRFQREAELGRRLNHPAVARTFESGTSLAGPTEHRFLVQELVEGRALRELMNELGTVPEPLLRDLTLQVARALTAIHAAGAVHRDLKPGNILVTPDHHVKVTDLGIAHLEDDPVGLTGTGNFVGSLLYAAPEQFGDEPVTPATDLYALGVLFFEMLTGQLPFRASDRDALLELQRTATAPDPRSIRKDCHEEARKIVLRLLEKNPAKRYRDGHHLLEELKRPPESFPS